jgi:hypothetical protein
MSNFAYLHTNKCFVLSVVLCPRPLPYRSSIVNNLDNRPKLMLVVYYVSVRRFFFVFYGTVQWIYLTPDSFVEHLVLIEYVNFIGFKPIWPRITIITFAHHNIGSLIKIVRCSASFYFVPDCWEASSQCVSFCLFPQLISSVFMCSHINYYVSWPSDRQTDRQNGLIDL